MKKIFSILLALVFILSLSSCGSKDKYSPEAVSAAEDAVYYAEKYINGDITADEADDYIDSIYDELMSDSDDNEEPFQDMDIDFAILNLSLSLSMESMGESNISDIKKEVSELKKMIK